jgi:hypothetical protein
VAQVHEGFIDSYGGFRMVRNAVNFMEFGHGGNLFLHGGYFCHKLHPLENITTGHWIFAGFFTVAFLGFLFWSYRKDAKTHDIHYGSNLKLILAGVVVLFVIYIFKRL